MATSIITLEDLENFKHQLLEEIKVLLSQRQQQQPQRWLKSHQVRRLLTISPGTLQHLRVKGMLPFTKVGGVIFYDLLDIEKMLLERKQNSEQAEQETLKQRSPK
ncbi:MAG: helix-turn-helix domain-containing protein [Cyclobacteriaceae bacterium]|nr:helix-turn-helix domain-containing protein [Cyclobacteriaceae bacterium]